MALVDELKVLLANAVSFNFKAWGYHWNVEGDDFHSFHDFFSVIQEDVEGSIDPTAEYIRVLGEYAPFKLTRFVELSEIPESNVSSEDINMSKDLYESNKVMINRLKAAFEAANQENEQGIADFIAGRLSQHQKWDWQLRVTLKEESSED